MAITINGTNGLTTDNGALKLDTDTLVVDETNNTVGIGTSSPVNKVTVNGGVSLLPYYETYLANSYYSGSWKYAGNGHAWGIGNNFGGPANGTTIAIAAVNASGAGAALTWNPVFNIDSSGRVTMPYQPGFLCRNFPAPSATSYPNALFKNGGVSYNTGSHFNNSTGRFTAPVSGVYFISFGCLTNGANSRVEIELFVNGSLKIRANESTGASSFGGAASSVTYYLNVNDYAEVNLTLGTMYNAHENNYFSVQLLG